MQPNLPPLMQSYVADELARVPSLIERVIHQTLHQLRQPRQRLTNLADERHLADLAHTLASHRDPFAGAFQEALTRGVESDLAAQFQGYQPQGAAAEPSRLTLMDEAEIAADVELARVNAMIQDQAEWEQRELATYTSSLAGLDHVEPATNPLRGEIMARAFWHAVDVLPMSRGHQVLLMHTGGEALAQVLKLHYAAATSRLEVMGVEPSRYRTGIPPRPPGANPAFEAIAPVPLASAVPAAAAAAPWRSTPTPPSPTPAPPAAASAPASAIASRPPAEPPADGALDIALETMPMPIADLVPPAEDAAARASHAVNPELLAARAAMQRQLMQWVQRRFAEVDALGELPSDLRLMLRKLRELVQQRSMRDAAWLEDDAHPAWAVLRRVHYQAQCMPSLRDPQFVAFGAFAAGLVEGALGSPEPGTTALRRVVDRLDAYLQRQFKDRLIAASADIDRLSGGAPTIPGGLDDAVLDPPGPEGLQALAWLREQQPGRWLKVHWQDRWTPMQLLWRSPGDRHWLLEVARPPGPSARAEASAEGWHREAIPASALIRLRIGGLLLGLGESR